MRLKTLPVLFGFAVFGLAGMAEKGKVLFVEDDRLTRKVVQHAFTGFGYEIQEAESAAEGIALFQANPAGYVAVVTDLNMEDPEAGYRVVRAVRDSNPTLPLYIHSSEEPTVIEARTRGWGVTIVPKPDLTFRGNVQNMTESWNRRAATAAKCASSLGTLGSIPPPSR